MDVLAALDLNFAGQAISLCLLLLMNLIVMSHRCPVCPMLNAVEILYVMLWCSQRSDDCYCKIALPIQADIC